MIIIYVKIQKDFKLEPLLNICIMYILIKKSLKKITIKYIYFKITTFFLRS